MNKQFTIEFIEEYRKFPCLWRIKSEEYRDKIMKNKAYSHLLNKMREVLEEATVQTVKNKIDSMRGSFRKELKKIKDSQRSGAGEEDVYKPHLWYFNNLLFLKDQETPRDSISNMDLEDNSIESHLNSPESETDIQELPVDREDASTPSMSTPVNKYLKNRPSFKRKRNKAEEVLEKVSKQLDAEKEVEDQYSVIGKTIAYKLRELPKETRLVTEKMINDILFEAQMGNITRHTRFNLQDTCTNVLLASSTPSLSQQMGKIISFNRPDASTNTPLVPSTSASQQHQMNATEQYYPNLGDCLNTTQYQVI